MNNVLVFLGIFWGVLDVCVIYINEKMKMVVVEVIVNLIMEEDLNIDYVILGLFDVWVVLVVVVVVVKVVMEIGVVWIKVKSEVVVENICCLVIIE